MSEPTDPAVKEIRQDGENVVAILTGEIDMHRAPQVTNAIGSLLESRPRRVIIDLSEVSYMDSSGVGTLVHLFRQVKANESKLVLVGPGRRVRSIFEITRLDEFFTICEDLQEALQQ